MGFFIWGMEGNIPQNPIRNDWGTDSHRDINYLNRYRDLSGINLISNFNISRSHFFIDLIDIVEFPFAIIFSPESNRRFHISSPAFNNFLLLNGKLHGNHG